MGFFDKLKERIAKTKANFSEKINNIVKNFRKVDEEFFEELEGLFLQKKSLKKKL